jgi:hypothetical protein
MPRIAYAQVYQDQRINLNTEDLTNQIDGITTTFTTTRVFYEDRVYVYYNGVRQQIGQGITVTSNNSFTTSFVPQNGDSLYIDYSPI